MTSKKKFWRSFMLGRLVGGGFRDVVREVAQISLFVFLIQSLKLVEALLALELGLLEKNSCWSVELKVRESLAVELEADREVVDNVVR